MKRISCWNDLTIFGIKPLTGEACGLSYRLLCDVTDAGKRIIEKCFDVGLKLAEPWNSGAIGAIMLSPEMLVPLGIFALLESGCKEVYAKGTDLIGIEPDDSQDQVAAMLRGASRRYAYEGTAGSRNRHEFSGRTT